MIRDERFLISRRPYAVDLASLALVPFGAHHRGTIIAVWFRRRRGVTAACVGTLWDHQEPKPADAAEFLARHDDGRYGGDCRSRWDGTSFWSASQDPDVQARDLALLKPMLAAYPAAPDGFDGWWRF